MKDADSVVLPGSLHDMNPVLWGEENQHANDVSNELDQIQWDIMKLAIPKKKPILGICRGIQFINVYFGGTLVQDLRAEKSTRLLIGKFSSSAQCKRWIHVGTLRGNLPSKQQTSSECKPHRRWTPRNGVLARGRRLPRNRDDSSRGTSDFRSAVASGENVSIRISIKQKETAEMLLRFFMKQMHE